MYLYDSLTKTLKQVKGGKAYFCGPTVYDYSHVGHGRTFLVMDLLHRTLLYKFGAAQVVQNITNINDKINHKAEIEGKTPQEIADFYTKHFLDNLQLLNILPVTHVKVTDYMDQIIKSVEQMLEQPEVYRTEDGIYIDTTKISYGFFEDNHESISRVKHHKRHLNDFALWKFGPGYNAPFGDGVPGWHMECTVMSLAVLGDLDIHGGGVDLAFPHHENEMAQYTVLYHKPMANLWLHSAIVNVNEEKMSKSLKNSIYLKDLVFDSFTSDVFRYFIYSHHYRSVINFSHSTWLRALSTVEDLRRKFFKSKASMQPSGDVAELYDDLDSNALLQRMHKTNNFNLLADLGFQFQIRTPLTVEQIEQLIYTREQAKQNGDFKEADKIREELEQQYVAVEDTHKSTIWYYT